MGFWLEMVAGEEWVRDGAGFCESKGGGRGRGRGSYGSYCG